MGYFLLERGLAPALFCLLLQHDITSIGDRKPDLAMRLKDYAAMQIFTISHDFLRRLLF